MHFVLAGPGALGCLLGSKLAGADRNNTHRFTLLDHNVTRAEKLSARGIQYRFQEKKEHIALSVSSSPASLGAADVILLCVKSYDVKQCLEFCKPLLTRETLVLFMQNGIAHLDLSEEIDLATPAYGTTTEGANMNAPGQVTHAGKGLTQFGFLGPVSENARKLLEQTCDLFNQSGLKARIVDDILSRLWTKLMVNTGINGLTATLNCTNGELLTLAGIPERMELLVNEALEVARASRIYVPEESLDITRDVCEKTSANVSSMLQDVRTGRRTEIDAINGAIVAAATKLNIDTPANRFLVQQVKELESGYL